MQNATDKVLYSVPELMKLIGIGRTRLYQELNSGKLKAVKVGARTYVSKENFETWMSSLERYQTDPQEVSHA